MKKIFSLLLALILVVGIMPTAAIAQTAASAYATRAFSWNYDTNALNGSLPTSVSWGNYRACFMSFDIPEAILAYKDKEAVITAFLNSDMTFNNGRVAGQVPIVTIVSADADIIENVSLTGGSSTTTQLKNAWANGEVLATFDTLTEDVSPEMNLTEIIKSGKTKIGLYITCREEEGYLQTHGIVNFNSPKLNFTAAEVDSEYYLNLIEVPYNIEEGYKLPHEVMGKAVTWSDGIEANDTTQYKTLTATIDGKSKDFEVMIMGKNENFVLAYTTEEMSMHLAVKTSLGWEKLNFGLGVLYENAALNDATVAGTTRALEKPYIYRKSDGKIGVAARGMTTGGVKDSFITLWETENLVDFVKVGTVNSLDGYESCERVKVDGFSGASCVFPVTDSEKDYLVKKLGEVKNISVEDITVNLKVGENFEGLSELTANYSDGSTERIPVKWNEHDLKAINTQKAGLYTVRGNAVVSDYPSPMFYGKADPMVISYKGKYYFIATNETGGQVDLYIRESDTLEGLETAKDVLIFRHTSSGDHSGCNWAPELHVINGELYCLFASSTTGSWNAVQARIMKCSGNPMNINDWEAPVRVTKKDGSNLINEGITLDMTYFEADGKHYYCWAERPITSAGNASSSLMLATMDPNDPYKITSDPVVLYTPSYLWDRRTSPIAEGAYVLQNNGKIYMTFSGSGVDNSYCVGLLTADEGADLLDVNSWKITGYPVLATEHVTGQSGPGHNAFTKDEYGRDILVTHMKPNGGTRSGTMRYVHYAFDGTPVLYMTAERYLKSDLRSIQAKIYVRDESLTEEEFELECIASSLKIDNWDEVRTNIELPKEKDGAKIEWASDNAAISKEGVVVSGKEDVKAILTATVTKNNLKTTRSFEVIIKAKEEDYAYLFAYFTGNNADQERLFYGVSLDGYNFRALNNGKSVLTSDLGTGCIRDPFIMKGEDGYYYIIATDMKSSLGWSSNYATVVYKTADLINIVDKEWINYREIKGAENCTRAWAPQVIWCPEKNAYMVYITMSIPSDPYATVMYRHYATDLCDASTYTELELMLDEPVSGAAAIDGDIIYDKFHDEYIMYYDGKRVATSNLLSGEWVHAETKYSDGQVPMYTAGGVSMAVEGSNIWKIIGEDKWVIAADGTPFNGGCYAMVETEDFENYTQLWESKGEYSFDFTPRHGYVIPISKRELDNLFEEYGRVDFPNPCNLKFKNDSTVYASSDREAYVIVSEYNSENVLVNVKTQKIEGEEEIPFTTPKNGTVKVMLWAKDEKPLCKAIKRTFN